MKEEGKGGRDFLGGGCGEKARRRKKSMVADVSKDTREAVGAYSLPSIMSSSILRPGLKAAARCSRRRTAPWTCSRGYAAAAAPQGEMPLETADEWTQFQVERAEFKTLGMSTFFKQPYLLIYTTLQSTTFHSLGLPKPETIHGSHTMLFTDQFNLHNSVFLLCWLQAHI